jgi:hypothetical protein
MAAMRNWYRVEGESPIMVVVVTLVVVTAPFQSPHTHSLQQRQQSGQGGMMHGGESVAVEDLLVRHTARGTQDCIGSIATPGVVGPVDVGGWP